jgi:hypothetical protein
MLMVIPSLTLYRPLSTHRTQGHPQTPDSSHTAEEHAARDPPPSLYRNSNKVKRAKTGGGGFFRVLAKQAEHARARGGCHDTRIDRVRAQPSRRRHDEPTAKLEALKRTIGERTASARQRARGSGRPRQRTIDEEDGEEGCFICIMSRVNARETPRARVTVHRLRDIAMIASCSGSVCVPRHHPPCVLWPRFGSFGAKQARSTRVGAVFGTEIALSPCSTPAATGSTHS